LAVFLTALPSQNTLFTNKHALMRKQGLLTALLLLPATMAFSAGYQLNLQGLRQLAMGGGGTAMPWDASTIFYNPGGLARLEGMQAYGSVQFILPRVQYLNQETGVSARTSNQTFTPFNLYVGGAIKGVDGLGVGVGVYTPFGSGTKWDDNWVGRYVTQSIYLQAVFIQPTISYRINEAVSIGAGYVYAFGNTEIAKAIPVQSLNGSDGQAKLSGNASGMGYNVGVSFKASDQLHFGLSYRSRVDMHVKDGEAKFTVPSAVAASFPNTSFDATLPLPEVFSIGAAWKPMEKLTVQADFNLTGWKAYDSLAFNYGAAVNGSMRTSAARQYQNRLASRLGAHYQASNSLAIMLGGAYDPTPVRDGYVSPDLPDANRLVLTTGFTCKVAPKLTVLAAVEYVVSDKRDASYDEANFKGTYQTKAITPGIGITYDF
jgi:long-chain fatty acid transport protein